MTFGRVGQKWCSSCERLAAVPEARFCAYCGAKLKPLTEADIVNRKINACYRSTRLGLERWQTINEDLYMPDQPLTCEIYLAGKPLSEYRFDD
jgi:hypothetical protein